MLVMKMKNENTIKLEQLNEQLLFLLERIQKVLPLYYSDLHEEIKNLLDKNRA